MHSVGLLMQPLQHSGAYRCNIIINMILNRLSPIITNSWQEVEQSWQEVDRSKASLPQGFRVLPAGRRPVLLLEEVVPHVLEVFGYREHLVHLGTDNT